MSRPTKALIDLTALRHNYALACRLGPQDKTLAVIKANAYGHGAIHIARELEAAVPAFGVACIEEALALRQAGVNKPILLLEGTFTADEVAIAVEQNFWLMVENKHQVQAIVDASLLSPVTAWIKADTGMNRLGFQASEFSSAYQQLKQSPNVCDEIVLSTHLACADDLSNPFTLEQMARFSALTTGLNEPVSLANSAGLLGWQQARAGWVRPGFMLYGVSPFTVRQADADQLKPVMQLQSAVISIRNIASGEAVGYGGTWSARRPSAIATVAIGYGDGYPQQAPQNTPVLINGQRAPIVGRVSMDMTMVDITDLSGVSVGSPVELWGSNLPINEVARHTATSAYELMTRMPSRVPRIYLG